MACGMSRAPANGSNGPSYFSLRTTWSDSGSTTDWRSLVRRLVARRREDSESFLPASSVGSSVGSSSSRAGRGDHRPAPDDPGVDLAD
jgi:hypothetical protein